MAYFIIIFLTARLGIVICEDIQFKWVEDANGVDKEFDNAIDTTTAYSVVNCLVTCTNDDDTVLATYHAITNECNCYGDNPSFIQSNVGNRLFNRSFKEDYILNRQLGMYIKFHHEDFFVHDVAENTCASEGARLLVLDTMEKYNYVTNLPQYKNDSYYHLAATDEDVEDTFVWSTGSIVSRDPVLWAPYQPDNWQGSQNCLCLFEYKFDDAFCYNTMYFVCELA